MELIAIDIGGTHARFAHVCIADDGTIELESPVVLSPNNFASFLSAWEHFKEQYEGAVPTNVALALPAPVNTDEIRITNIKHWMIRRKGLAKRMGVKNLTLINDFGAIAHAAACLPEEHFRHIAGPDVSLPASGTISVIGPGTGLGVAQLWRSGHGDYHVQSTEGGHIDFAPIDEIDDAILKRLRERYQRVSVERIASGGGLSDIYEALAALEGRSIVPKEAKDVWALADKGQDALALASVDRFCLALGTAVGDYALAHGASGVVLAGGAAQLQADKLIEAGFHTRFTAKGRFRTMMENIPIKLITHPQPGLYGAAAAFAAEHSALL